MSHAHSDVIHNDVTILTDCQYSMGNLTLSLASLMLTILLLVVNLVNKNDDAR